MLANNHYIRCNPRYSKIRSQLFSPLSLFPSLSINLAEISKFTNYPNDNCLDLNSNWCRRITLSLFSSGTSKSTESAFSPDNQDKIINIDDSHLNIEVSAGGLVVFLSAISSVIIFLYNNL